MARQQWEYLAVECKGGVRGEHVEVLNGHGAEGWELVGVSTIPPIPPIVPGGSWSRAHSVLLLKRALELPGAQER